MYTNFQVRTTATEVTPNFLPYSGDYPQISHRRGPSLTLGQSFCMCGPLRDTGKGFRMSNKYSNTAQYSFT
jgi:hypothetical protein